MPDRRAAQSWKCACRHQRSASEFAAHAHLHLRDPAKQQATYEQYHMEPKRRILFIREPWVRACRMHPSEEHLNKSMSLAIPFV
jgi:hypothetical protein